jgi:hypothetical protein
MDMSVYPPIVVGSGSVNTFPRQRRIVGASFSMRSLSYRREVDD